jgi:hypothetical protein
MREMKILLATIGTMLIIGGLIGMDTALQLSNVQSNGIDEIIHGIIELQKAFILYTISLIEIVGGIIVILYITKIK